MPIRSDISAAAAAPVRAGGTAWTSAAGLPVWAWAGLAAIVAARVAILALTHLDLYPDEAQYWGWAQTPAFGYYSKPPLIAWMIGATTGLFGDAEWAVRLSAPLCHGAAAAALMLLGRDLYGPRAGVLAGAIWLTMMGVGLSSFIISTDAPLLALWSFMLLSLFRLVSRPSAGWAAALGAAVGLGFMAKYAMVYAVIAVALAMVLDGRVRAALWSRYGALALGVAAALFAPNLIWNAANGMETVAHTADNADWIGPLFNPGELLEFWVTQLGVFGPVVFPLLVVAMVRAALGRAGRDAALLALFAAIPLAVVSAQAFVAHSYANWAGAAYPSGAVLVAGLLAGPEPLSIRAPGRWPRRALIALAILGNLAFTLPGTAALVSPRVIEAAGMENAFKQVRGWEETADRVAAAAAEGGFDTAVFDDRFAYHAADYYRRGQAPAVAMYQRYAEPYGHAEACCALPSGTAGPVLLVSAFADYDPWFAKDFAQITPLGEIVVELGGGVQRRLRLFSAEGYEKAERPPGDGPYVDY